MCGSDAITDRLAHVARGGGVWGGAARSLSSELRPRCLAPIHMNGEKRVLEEIVPWNAWKSPRTTDRVPPSPVI
eukprot:1327908-Prymnesium_polylepis.1